MNKPYVFLDIDGVLNALSAEPSHKGEIQTVMGYVIHVRDRVRQWLCEELPELADAQWATTWEDNANTHLCPAYDLPCLPVAARDDLTQFSSQYAWKLHGVLDTVTSNPKPFVWIDDVVTTYSARDTVKDILPDEPHLIIRTNSYSGITDDEIDQVNDFLKEYS